MSEGIIDKIRKLLALSESPNENEAALAAEKAAEMAAKHGIEMASIAMDEGRTLAAEGGEVEARLTPWRKVLYSAVARSMGGKTVNKKEGGRRNVEGRIHFYGPPGTTEAMIALARYLDQQVLSISAVATTTRVERWINGRTFRSEFQMGMVCRLDQRLEERKREREAASDDSMALVVISKAVDAAIEDNHPNRTNGVVRYGIGLGYHKGTAAGDGVDLRDPALGRERAALGTGA